MGILDEAIREIVLERRAAEDDLRQAMEDFDIITSRAIDTVKRVVAALQLELLAADWWMDDLREDAQRPDYVSLSFHVRRHSGHLDVVSNPDYSYTVKFDALGGAVRTAESSEPLLDSLILRAVARPEFAVDLERDLKLFLKAILAKSS